MDNVTRRPQQRTAFTIVASDGTTGTVRRIDHPTVLGLPARHRQYEMSVDLGNGDRRQYTFTRPFVQLLLRQQCRIVGRVA